jgi:hypothetical protein
MRDLLNKFRQLNMIAKHEWFPKIALLFDVWLVKFDVTLNKLLPLFVVNLINSIFKFVSILGVLTIWVINRFKNIYVTIVINYRTIIKFIFGNIFSSPIFFRQQNLNFSLHLLVLLLVYKKQIASCMRNKMNKTFISNCKCIETSTRWKNSFKIALVLHTVDANLYILVL